MKKIAWLSCLLCVFSLLAPTLAQGEAFPLPAAVQALLKAQFPDHALTSFSGFGNEESGQFALVVSRAGEHRLLMAEKGAGEAAYAVTINNPTAFPSGDCQPRVLVDTGGDGVFLSFQQEGDSWSFHAVKQKGAWGAVDAMVAFQRSEAGQSEWTMTLEKGFLHCMRYETDGNDNVTAWMALPPLPAPQFKDNTGLSNYHWRDFPDNPSNLVNDAQGEALQALFPKGWQAKTACVNQAGIPFGEGPKGRHPPADPRLAAREG